jgi:transcriptional regulator with XRE-family HTH domain
MGIVESPIIGSEVKAARALLGWSQVDLAKEAHVSIVTIKRLEAKGGPIRGRSEIIDKIQRALEAAGVRFFDHDDYGASIGFKRPATKKRK